MNFQTLRNGIKIPTLGLGTWFIDDAEVDQAVVSAVKIGYRHIDTAQAYGNERGIGVGIKACGVPREELFITSKVAAENKDYDSAAKSIDETIAKMGLDYIDMMIIHSPQPWADFRGGDYSSGNREAWRALEDAYDAGKVKAIGVSNFLKADIENILADCRIRPMVNQILLHVGNTNMELINYCKEQGILIEAYSPIAHGEALKNETIMRTAQKYGVSAPQLCVKYVLNLGAIALPKTASEEHMRSNADLNFEISDEDMETLKSLDFKNYGEYSMFPVFSGK